MQRRLLMLVLFMMCKTSFANVVWVWNFDTEYGYLVTNGTLADTIGPHTFDIISFQVYDSQFPANIGANYLVNQPVQGFMWDGVKPTQFFRSSGAFINGSNFFLENTNLFYGLTPAPGFSVFGVVVRNLGGSTSGLLKLKTEIVFKNQFE